MFNSTSASGLWYWVLVPYERIEAGPMPAVGYNADGELEEATCYDVKIRSDFVESCGISATQRVTYEQFLGDDLATLDVN